jgi:hypothetical protein
MLPFRSLVGEKTRGLLTVGDAELRKDMSKVVLDRSLIDVKTRSDISVAHPLGHVRKNL